MMNAPKSRDVVDVRVRDYDRANFQVKAIYDFHDPFGVSAGIDHDCCVRVRVAYNVAIALQHADGKYFMDEVCGFSHLGKYSSHRSIGRLAENAPHSAKMKSCSGTLETTMPLETPLLDLHRSAHAKIGEYFGTLLPSRFGDFAAEYSAARGTVALVDTNYRAFFNFSGPDAQRYVNAVLTSNVRDLKPGLGAVGLLLTPQGHILAEVETFGLDSGILAASHNMVRERTFSTFDKFIIMDDVTLTDATPSLGTLDLVGPRAAALISESCGIKLGDLPELAHQEITLGSIPCRIVHRKFAGHSCATLIVASDQLSPLWRELEARVRAQGGTIAGMEAIDSIRLECGIAWFGADYDDKNIPHEAGLELSHISYEKGCYTGQEIVERVRSRGHANRRLNSLQFLVANPPAAGTKLFVQGNAAVEAGYVTSAAVSPLLERPIGLGYVRREHAAIGTRLDAAGATAEVISPPLHAITSRT